LIQYEENSLIVGLGNDRGRITGTRINIGLKFWMPYPVQKVLTFE